MIRTELIHGPSSFEKLAQGWGDLADNSPSATPFQTWQWQSTWFKHYGLGKKLQIFAVYEGKDLVGLAPFVKVNGPWRTLRWAGGGPSDYLHPLARAGFEMEVNGQILERLTHLSKVDLVDLHQVRENQLLAETVEADTVIEQATCLVLDLPPTFEEYLQTIGKSLRYDVRKLQKDLFNKGDAVMETIEPDGVQVGFDIFLEQHKARWRERRMPGAFVGRSLSFHREWIHLAADKGWLRLKILRHLGEPAGAIYAMQFNDTLYYYQAGFDPAHKAISPGTLVVAHTIQTGIEAGVKHFDFMRGDEPYKRRWKPQHIYKNRRLLLVPGPARGNFGRKWNEMAHRLEMKVRTRLEGGGPA